MTATQTAITAKGRITGRTYSFKPKTEIAAGGEGLIYNVQYNNHEVAKVYKDDKLSSERSKKLEIMVANPPNNIWNKHGYPTIAFPTDALEYTGRSRGRMKNGQVIGFIMPKLQDQMKKIFNFSDSRNRLINNPFFTYDYLMTTALNFAMAVHSTHERNYVIGDINESNILVDENKTFVTLIDTDSFQVEDPKSGQVYRCPVGKPEYTAPELQGKNFENENRFLSHDLFGMAIILYQLLMENAHPFTGVYQGIGDPPKYSESIKKGFFVHTKKTKSPYRPQSIALPFETLNPDIRNLFLRCFEDGHHDPSARPTAKEWSAVLRYGRKRLTTCNKNPHHYFGDHLTSCPWCERICVIKMDPFPTRAEAPRIRQAFKDLAAQKSSNAPGPKPAINFLPTPVIKNFQPNTTSIKEGESLTLSWQVENAQSVSISPGFANLAGSGSITVSPRQNTNYILKATVCGTSVDETVNITVVPKPDVIFETSADSVLLGQPVTLSWDVAARFSVEINNGIGHVSNKGKITVTPVKYFWGLLGIKSKRNIVYKLTAVNQQERIKESLKIGIRLPASPPKLANYISLALQPMPLDYQTITLVNFINLNGVIKLFKNNIGLLKPALLSKHLKLKEISVPLADFIALIDRGAGRRRHGYPRFYKKLL